MSRQNHNHSHPKQYPFYYLTLRMLLFLSSHLVSPLVFMCDEIVLFFRHISEL